MLKLTSLALLAASGSAGHMRTSETLTATTTDTAFLEAQGWFGDAINSVGRVFTGHTKKQDEYMEAKLNYAVGRRNVETTKEEASTAAAAFEAAKKDLKQITEANTKTKETTEPAEALREKQRLLVEQAEAAVVTAEEVLEESKDATERAIRKEAATEKELEAKGTEYIEAKRVFGDAGKKVDSLKANLFDLKAKLAAIVSNHESMIAKAIEKKAKKEEQKEVEQISMADLDKKVPAKEAADTKVEAKDPVKEAADADTNVEAKDPVKETADTLAATKEAQTEAEKAVKTAMDDEKKAGKKKTEKKEELEKAKTQDKDALKTLAASEETDKKAATKKKDAQTNADKIKNSDGGINAQEAAEQKMKQDEADAREVVEKTRKVKQETEQVAEKAEKELARLGALLTEKRTAYADEKATALKKVTDGTKEAEKRAAVAEEDEKEAATEKAQMKKAKEDHAAEEKQVLDQQAKIEGVLAAAAEKEADAQKIKVDQNTLVADGNKKAAELEKKEVVEAAQKPEDPGYVAPKVDVPKPDKKLRVNP